LKVALEENIEKENQVVYILSRIREYLESKELKKDFPIMNFFCNWALHIKIEDTKPVEWLIKTIVYSKENISTDIIIATFYSAFNDFIGKVWLPMGILEDNNFKIFKFLLLDIYSSTPLIIKTFNKIEIEIIKNEKTCDYNIFVSGKWK